MPNEPERLLSLKEVIGLTGWTRQHIRRLEKAGAFPERIRMGANTVRWSAPEITAWLETKKAERRQ